MTYERVLLVAMLQYCHGIARALSPGDDALAAGVAGFLAGAVIVQMMDY